MRMVVPALRTLVGLAPGLLLALFAGPAQARTERLEWEHPDPDQVAGYQVHYGTVSGSYSTVVDVGKPAAGPDNVVAVDFDFAAVPDDAVIYVAVSAYGPDGETSPLSNERERAPAGSGGSTGGSGGQTGDDGATTAPAGAVWFENFQTMATGSAVPGWLDTVAGYGLAEDDALFGVVEFAGGNRSLTTSSSDTGIHSHYVGQGSSGWASYEVTGRLLATDSAARLGVTAYSGFDSEAVYYRLGTSWQTGEFELYGYPFWGEQGISCSSQSTGVILEANVWYRYRMQVTSEATQTVVVGKVWKEGAAEPADWQGTCTDNRSSRRAAGTVGVWSAQAGEKRWDDFAMIPLDGTSSSGTDGEPLGMPGKPYLLQP
jgi:hypothetical protein